MAAQSAFFTEYQPNQVQMTTEQSARYTSLQDTAISKSVQIVATADIRTSQPNDTIFFQLPGDTDTLWAEASLITDDSTKGFVWSGRLLNQPGYMSVFYHNGLVAGFIQTGGKFYELMPMDTFYQFFVERNNDVLRACGTPSSSTPPPDSIEPDKCKFPTGYNTYNTCPALLSVLLVITEEAKDWILLNYGSMDAYAIIGQAMVNLAFYNSDIPNKEIRIEWIERDLSGFLSANLNIASDAEALPILLEDDREEHKADVAVLVTNQGYGVAGAVTNYGPSTDEAFAIIEAPYLIAQYVLAHELAHLFGCRHNWLVDLGNDSEDICAHAKRWIQTPVTIFYDEIHEVPYTWSTIVGVPLYYGVAYPVEDDSGTYYLEFLHDERILHYSNPDVDYNFVPTGRDQGYIANNALYIRNEACTVDSFFPTRELAVLVVYPQGSPCLTTNIFSAHITPPESGVPGQPPYTVRWFTNTTGLFSSNDPGEYLGQGADLTLNDYPDCPVFWLKCVVTSSDNVTVSRVHKVSIGSAGCCEEEEEKTSTSTAISSMGKLYPNPVSGGFLTLSLENWKNSEVDCLISDLCGRLSFESSAMSDVKGDLRIDVGGLGAGVYLLRLRTPTGETQNFKFIITQN